MTRTRHTIGSARLELDNAIAALIDPRPHNHDGTHVEWLDPIYVELRHAVTGTKQGRTGTAPASAPPAWIDGIDLCRDIDRHAARWEPNPDGPDHPTVNRLRRLRAQPFTPHDLNRVLTMTRVLTTAVTRYKTLTDPKPKYLPNPCPECGAQTAHRLIDGERLRFPALQITCEDCTCLACNTTWPARNFGLLAARLGYTPPAGVLP